MPRRRPGALRAAQDRGRHRAVIPGLSPSVCHTLDRLDRADLRPDAVAAALRSWQHAAREPVIRSLGPYRPTGPIFDDAAEQRSRSASACPPCAREVVDEPSPREVLGRALYALPRGKARQLRGLVHRADRRVLDRTLPDPHRPPDRPWWRQRLLPG